MKDNDDNIVKEEDIVSFNRLKPLYYMVPKDAIFKRYLIPKKTT